MQSDAKKALTEMKQKIAKDAISYINDVLPKKTLELEKLAKVSFFSLRSSVFRFCFIARIMCRTPFSIASSLKSLIFPRKILRKSSRLPAVRLCQPLPSITPSRAGARERELRKIQERCTMEKKMRQQLNTSPPMR